MIDPGTNPNGETVEDYCRRRWGGSGWTNHLKSEGKKDGAMFGNWQWWPHTSRAHQLVQYCDENGIGSTDKVNQFLFRAQYEDGENISDIFTLVQIGKKLGLLEEKESELTEYLMQDQGKAKVKQDISSGRQRYGISGVPFFVIGKDDSSRPYAFSGAQNTDTFLDVFEELSS
jgi:predicted DsbA family dithiol-disulfide isomerase